MRERVQPGGGEDEGGGGGEREGGEEATGISCDGRRHEIDTQCHVTRGNEQNECKAH